MGGRDIFGQDRAKDYFHVATWEGNWRELANVDGQTMALDV